ncbi:MAG TPA: serine/threonine-protein kinase [Polyangiaceae bacterium]|nr:serine/threonine-protein kinase [Polyangiaceae bacterium]
MTEELKQGSRLGNYELLLRVGRGGMATVWVARERAHASKDDRLVAVKVMLTELADENEFIKMFLDEVRLVRSIRHPNVVDVYDVGEHDGMMWMAMEWVEGESLHTVIAEAGKRRAIPPELAVRIISDAAAGLHAAHELRDVDGSLRGVVHRDISPHNILIGTNGTVKLVDFGVAKAVGRISEATRAGQLKGKFGYMSPEQALGKGVDRRSDIFSLGIVLFELTTSRRLFRGDHDLETLRLVISGAIPKPSMIDPKYPLELERIVLKALERNVSERYQTAAEFEHDLHAYLKAERLIVPRSGVAGILKRVLGERIEQRRKAVRASLRALSSGAVPTAQLLPNDPAFTPTGKERGTSSGVSNVTDTGLSGLSGFSSPGTSPSAVQSAPHHPSRPVMHSVPARPRLSTASVLGYAIGLTGLAIALFVLIFMR